MRRVLMVCGAIGASCWIAAGLYTYSGNLQIALKDPQLASAAAPTDALSTPRAPAGGKLAYGGYYYDDTGTLYYDDTMPPYDPNTYENEVDTYPDYYTSSDLNDYYGYYNDEYDAPAYYDTYYTTVTSEPWYVQSFPGIGSMVQTMIPGAGTFSPPVVSTPAPAPIIVAPPHPLSPPPACTISANPASIPYGGTTQLNWVSRTSTGAILSGIGTVPPTGSYTFSNVADTRAVTLTVFGPGGSSSCYTTITVGPRVVSPSSCIISAHPAVIAHGQSASVAWGSQNALSATLQGVGGVPVQGAITVTPAASTIYTLIVSNQLGTNTCTTNLVVN